LTSSVSTRAKAGQIDASKMMLDIERQIARLIPPTKYCIDDNLQDLRRLMKRKLPFDR
jgi:hypothetical protein